MNNLLKLILTSLIVILLLTAGPWCFLWSINTLAHAAGFVTFNIPFTFWTWLAALILGGLSVFPAARRS